MLKTLGMKTLSNKSSLKGPRVSKGLFPGASAGGVFWGGASFHVVWRTAGRVPFLFSGGLLLVLAGSLFWVGEGHWVINSWNFNIILNFPNFLRSYVLRSYVSATRIYQFINNNQVSFHLWWKKNLVKTLKILWRWL